MITRIPGLGTQTNITEQINAELAKMAQQTKDTEAAVKKLTPFELKLYNYYRKYMADHVNYTDDKYNPEIEKRAGLALEQYAGNLYDQTSKGKKAATLQRSRYLTPEQVLTLNTQKRIAVLEAAQKVTALYQKQVMEAKAELEKLGLKEVLAAAQDVIEYAKKRDAAYAEAEEIEAGAKKIENEILKKYALKEAHGKRFTAEMYENGRASAALRKIKATNTYRTNVLTAGKQKEYELVHGESFTSEQIPEQLVSYETIQAQLYG